MDKFYEKINVNQIVSIKKRLSSYFTHFVWKEESKFLRFKLREAGFYYTYTLGKPYLVPIEVIEEMDGGIYFCRDKIVWFKPHIEIKMADGNKHEKYFQTADELDEFLNSELMNSVKWCITQ